MKSPNRYKDIVICTVIVLLASICMNLCKVYLREQKSYGFLIQSQRELTTNEIEEFEKISGIYGFEPVSSTMVTISLEEYNLETKLIGVDLKTYPLDWEKTKDTIVLGNTSALFFGTDVFWMFSDKNGHSPSERKIKKWMEQELVVTITDAFGHSKKGKIFGILKSPGNLVCMDQSQLEEIFKDSCQITGGHMEIYGYKNAKKAKDILEQGGFSTEFDKDINEL